MASNPRTFHLFFVLCDFSCFLLFLCCSFFGVAFVEISDFLFFIFWLSRSFRLKKASKHLIFHLFFRVLRFFVFSVIFVLFVFRRRLRWNFGFFIFRFLAFGVVSFEKGFKSPYFSSLFSRFAIFLVFCYFCVVRFSASPSLKFWFFIFRFFGFGGRFAWKRLQIPLLFISFFVLCDFSGFLSFLYCSFLRRRLRWNFGFFIFCFFGFGGLFFA